MNFGSKIKCELRDSMFGFGKLCLWLVNSDSGIQWVPCIVSYIKIFMHFISL